MSPQVVLALILVGLAFAIPVVAADPVVSIVPGGIVTCAAFSPNGSILIMGTMNGTLHAYVIGTWELLWETAASTEGQITAIAASQNGRLVAAALAGEGSVLVLDAESGAERRTIRLGDPFTSIESIAFSPDSTLLACADARTTADDIRVKLVSPASGADAGTPIELDLCCWALPFEVVFSSDGQFLVGGGFGRIIMWDLATKSVSKDLEGTWFRPGYFDGVAMSPDGTMLVAGGYETNKLLLWDTDTWEETVLEVEGSNTRSTSVAFSPSGELMATGYRNYVIWDPETLNRLWTESASNRGTTWIGFSPDGTYFAGLRFSKPNVTVWEVANLIGN